MKLNAAILSGLCSFFQYPLASDPYVLFAIRGALPDLSLKGNHIDSIKYKHEQLLIKSKVNFSTARCSIGVWNTGTGYIAVFPGSTVPSLSYLYKNVSKLETFNVLCPGMYMLTKGIHPRSSTFQQHEALLMNGYGMVAVPEVIKGRSSFRFSKERINYKVLLPGDNLHAARTEPLGNDAGCTFYKDILDIAYSSSGCITIAGQPRQYITSVAHANDSWNYWESFMDLLRSSTEGLEHFRFLLFDYADLQMTAYEDRRTRIRYGTQSKAVEQLQHVLMNVLNCKTGKYYYEGKATGLFTENTAAAYLEFYRDVTGKEPFFELIHHEMTQLTKHFITV